MTRLQSIYSETAKEIEAALATVTNPAFIRHKNTAVVEGLIFAMSTTIMNLKVQGIKKDWRYVSPEHLLLAHGDYFKSYRKLPKGFKMMEPKQCIGNSQEVALLRPECTYVEGAVTSVIGAIKHAWVRTDEHELIDVTLRPLAKPDKTMAKMLFEAGHVESVKAGMKPLGTAEDDANREYFGVAIRTDYVRASVLEQNLHTCLIDNWERDWPLLVADDATLRKALANPKL